MRKFFILKSVITIYFCCVLGLSYRLVYNEYYGQIHRGVEVSYEDGEFVYLSMTLSVEYADDVAICLTAVEGVDLTGTEIYAW